MPPAVCFTVIPMAQIYLFAFRSRGKASLPFFGNVRTHWAVEMHNTGGACLYVHVRPTRPDPAPERPSVNTKH